MKNQAKNVNRRTRYALAATLILAGCASRVPAPVIERGSLPAAVVHEAAPSSRDLYTVKKGDTVRSIARAHGIDFRELIAWNAIENANSIQPGMTLRIKPTGSSGTSGSSFGSEVAVSRPITGAPIVENRSLESSYSPSNGSSVSSATPAGAAGVSGIVGINTPLFKREPKGGKEVYSDAALAQAQGPKAAESASLPTSRPDLRSEVKPELKPEANTSTSALAGSSATANEEEVEWIWPSHGKIIGTFSEGASKGVDIAGKPGDPVLAAGEGKVVYSGTGLRGYGKLVIVKHNNTYLSAYAHNQNVLVKEGQSVSKGQKIAEMGNTDADQVKLHFEVRRQGKPVDPLKFLPPR